VAGLDTLTRKVLAVVGQVGIQALVELVVQNNFHIQQAI
jgi:hypothetical protein